MYPNKVVPRPHLAESYGIQLDGGKKMGRAGIFFTTTGHGFNVSTVGIILMVVGVVGLVASGIVFATSRRPVGSGNHTYDRQATNAEGQSTEVHEEVHS
jgi:hypothetical protein